MKGKVEFEEAVRSAYPTLYRAAVVLTGNAADAEDAVQETLFRAFKAYGTFRGESSATTWMYRILIREAGRIRRNARPTAQMQIEAPLMDTRNPHGAASQSDEFRRALAILRDLAERQREMVTLFYLEDLSYREVADTLGVSIGTVKSALSRARTVLRERLERVRPQRKVADELPR